MENTIQTTPAIPVIPEVPVAPIVAPVIPEVKQTFDDGGQLNSGFFNFKPEYVIIVTLGIISAAYTMSILYYRKGIQTNNTIQNLQNQIDQLKLKTS